MKMKRINRIALGTLLALLPAGAWAYETEWFDKKVDEKEAISGFRADGTVFAGYENADRERNGNLEQNGTRNANGFVVSRGYLNLRGDVLEGPWKGFNFRVTVDGGNIANTSINATNSTTSTGSNAQVAELKFAYFSVPLYFSSFGDGSLRLGMQQVAIVDGQAGYSNESYWKHRYIDQNAVEKSGFAGGSADKGLSFIHKADYFGLHLFLANGENFRRNNGQALFQASGAAGLNGPLGQPSVNAAGPALTTAQATQVRTNLTNLVNGNNGTAADSYGLDLYGLPSIHPTGKAKDIDISVAFPFRLQNIVGIKREEWDFATVDASTPVPRFDAYRGNSRAKQDATFGQEVAAAFDLDIGLKLTVGLGQAVLRDKRESAVRNSQNGDRELTAATSASRPYIDYTTQYQWDRDAFGRSSWGYVHAKFGSFGILARQIYGTGNGTLQALPRKSYAQQLVEVDLRDNNIGNGDITTLSTRGSNPTIDLGKARFKRETYAVTWSPFSRFAVALGVELLKTWDKNGERSRVSELANVPTFTAGTSAAAQADSSLAALGITSNDLGGKPRDQKQIFIRATYEF